MTNPILISPAFAGNSGWEKKRRVSKYLYGGGISLHLLNIFTTAAPKIRTKNFKKNVLIRAIAVNCQIGWMLHPL